MEPTDDMLREIGKRKLTSDECAQLGERMDQRGSAVHLLLWDALLKILGRSRCPWCGRAVRMHRKGGPMQQWTTCPECGTGVCVMLGEFHTWYTCTHQRTLGQHEEDL